MAQPSTRQELIDYAKRKLGAPVLEINVADEQIDDLVDDAFQYFHERHFDGVQQTYLKYQFTQEDIDRGRSPNSAVTQAGIVTTTAAATIDGASVTFSYKENSNYIQIPPAVIGINKIFRFDTGTITGGMFSLKYQLFLNDIYSFSSMEMLSYAMTMERLSDIDFLLNTDSQIRFNQRVDRLYLDIDYGAINPGEFIVIDCNRLVDPDDFSRVYNDSFVKLYLTALIKRQWGQNLMKFQGVKLPGGVELNGRQIYDDAEKDIERIMEKMSNTYEIPPLDMIG